MTTNELAVVAVVWAVAAFGVALLAQSRGHGFVVWFLLALFLSPLLMGVLVIVAPEKVVPLTPAPERDNRTVGIVMAALVIGTFVVAVVMVGWMVAR